ncbi:MAG: bifunctional salicylyl-CoA 5-hydroxylase/oxidoreductase [Planctomycetes bacterium]|nr:bifunctional salicylyl-CoA 5-hydroxylase/oxidoreductase [Planctomycetota bacterium]
MRIVSIGGGPGGLYASILFKKAFPEAEITVYERNKPDDTFGWGVVFSDETLSGFEDADAETYRAILDQFIYWSDMDTYVGGTMVRSTGHGFCGMSRKRLLNIFQDRARELGVELRFEEEVTIESAGPADLILAADGVNSAIRNRFAGAFEPDLDWRKCKFTWLGTTMPMAAFTFIFKETEWGLFQVHAYPFEEGLGTFIVECREEVWNKAGLDQASEEETVAFCERIFAEDLKGARLLNNRSIWRTFPTIKCKTWIKDNVVLLGDAAHTAHFSIGSGTKLAMESAIVLVDAFVKHGFGDVPRALAAYEEARFVDVLRLQKTAQTSLEWFENSARYLGQDPVQFTFNLMTRSKRITYENLEMRDPKLVADTREVFRRQCGAPTTSLGDAPPPAFTPFTVGPLRLANRIVVSPMCQYSAVEGVVNDWHLVHYGSRALGGAALVIAEMTNVEPEGRITTGCAGLWDEEQMEAWEQIVDHVHRWSKAKIGIQIAHAGRKASTFHPWDRADDRPLTEEEGAWTTYGPSAIPFRPDWPAPKAMDRGDMDRIRDAFVRSAELALAAGFDLVELHMAHGYLLSSFLSPLSNHRTDDYGGSLENRMRFPLEVLEAVRAVWPRDRALAVRISASDWGGDEGQTIEDSVIIARALQARGVDLIDVSSGGNVADLIPVYGRMYQVPFAEQIRFETGMKVMAVGAIQGADHANTVIAAGRADLCALARPHLADPYLTLHAASHYGYPDQYWPGQYLAGRPAIDKE